MEMEQEVESRREQETTSTSDIHLCLYTSSKM
jgi:hypothetical protein